MTRRSKREIERALEKLGASDDTTDSAEPIAEQYPPQVADIVQETVRDIMRLTFDFQISNSEAPARALLPIVRETYDIDDDRDDAVLAALDDRGAQIGSGYWRRKDTFETALAAGPRLFDTAARDRFEGALKAGETDVAARLIVRTVYDALADQGGSRREVPA